MVMYKMRQQNLLSPFVIFKEDQGSANGLMTLCSQLMRTCNQIVGAMAHSTEPVSIICYEFSTPSTEGILFISM